eukprot:1764643-Ditylum_brightwellii.AAC.1
MESNSSSFSNVNSDAGNGSADLIAQKQKDGDMMDVSFDDIRKNENDGVNKNDNHDENDDIGESIHVGNVASNSDVKQSLRSRRCADDYNGGNANMNMELALELRKKMKNSSTTTTTVGGNNNGKKKKRKRTSSSVPTNLSSSSLTTATSLEGIDDRIQDNDKRGKENEEEEEEREK